MTIQPGRFTEENSLRGDALQKAWSLMGLSQLDQVVKILQVGFSGFAFLMAGLSFRLLRAESARDGPGRKAILAAVERYTRYTFVLAILVAATRFGEDGYRAYLERQRTEAVQRSSDADTCRAGLSRLLGADAHLAKDYPGLLIEVKQDSFGCQSILKWLERYQADIK